MCAKTPPTSTLGWWHCGLEWGESRLQIGIMLFSGSPFDTFPSSSSVSVSPSPCRPCSPSVSSSASLSRLSGLPLSLVSWLFSPPLGIADTACSDGPMVPRRRAAFCHLNLAVYARYQRGCQQSSCCELPFRVRCLTMRLTPIL